MKNGNGKPKAEPKSPETMWTNYTIRLQFLDRLCGSVPGDPEMIKAWLEARMPAARPANTRSISEIQEEVLSTLAAPTETPEEEYERKMLIFQRMNGGLVLRASTFRSHIKESARTLSSQWIGKLEGERSFSSKVLNGLYHDEKQYWVPILDSEGKPVTQASGIKEKAVHARMPNGQMLNALKAFEYVEGARVTFRLKALGDSVREKDLQSIFMYGGVHGYGGERGDGEGRYTFTIEKESE